MWYPRESLARNIDDVEIKRLEGIAHHVSEKMLRQSDRKGQKVEHLQSELLKIQTWQWAMLGEQREVLDEANAIRAECQKDIKKAKARGRIAKHEQKKAEEKGFQERTAHRTKMRDIFAEYAATLKATKLTHDQEVGILNRMRFFESSGRKKTFKELRDHSRKKMDALYAFYATEHSKLDGQMMLAEDHFCRCLRARDDSGKRVKELGLLVGTKSAFNDFFAEKQEDWRPLEKETLLLEREVVKLDHALKVFAARVEPIMKLMKKMPEMRRVAQEWQAKVPLFDLWTDQAKAAGQLLEQRYADQSRELVKDYEARDEMLHYRFSRKFEHMEAEKNSRVANAMHLCQVEKDALEAVVREKELELEALRKESSLAATEMGALRIEVANLEDAVQREAELVAAQERDLAASQAALLAEAFRGRVHDTKQAIVALTPSLEYSSSVFETTQRPPSPPASPKHGGPASPLSPQLLGLEPTEDHALHTMATSIATIEEPKHGDLAELCGSMTDLQREILRIGVEEGPEPEEPENYEPTELELMNIADKHRIEHPDVHKSTFKFAQELADLAPLVQRTYPLKDTDRADRLAEAATIFAADTRQPEPGTVAPKPRLGATESTELPAESGTREFLPTAQLTSELGAGSTAELAMLQAEALGTAELSGVLDGPAEDFGQAVDRLTADMQATAEGIERGIRRLDEWEDLFGEPRPPTPQPTTPRHLISTATPAYELDIGLPPKPPTPAVELPRISRPLSAASEVPTEATVESETGFLRRAFDVHVLEDIAVLDDLGLRYDQPEVAASRLMENVRVALTPTASSVGDLDDD